MKTTVIFIFLAMFMSNIALAEKGEKRERPDIDALIVQLKLDDSKAEKFKAILEKQKQEIQARREQNRAKSKEGKTKMTREQRQELHKQREAQRDAMDEKLLTVLSYEQLYKFKKYMRQFRQQRGMRKDRQKSNRENSPEDSRR